MIYLDKIYVFSVQN